MSTISHKVIPSNPHLHFFLLTFPFLIFFSFSHLISSSSYCSSFSFSSSYPSSSSSHSSPHSHATSILIILSTTPDFAQSISRFIFVSSRKSTHLSSISGLHCVKSQSISLRAPSERQGSRHNSTTTESLFAGIKPRRKTFLQPQL